MASTMTLKIAVAQLNSSDSIQKNIEQINSLVDQAHAADCKICFFPENSLYMRIVEGEAVPVFEHSSTEIAQLAQRARDKSINLHFGSLPFKDLDGHTYNASLWITADGSWRVSYRKIHLFDIQLQGQKPIRESDVFKSGLGPELLEFEQWKFGQSICYDLRFAELYSVYGKLGVDAILVPAAFLVPTGVAHWETLLRARAIENQCYVIAAAQAGAHKSTRQLAQRETYGHSLIIDPWGKVQECLADGIGLIVGELDRGLINKVRQQIPMASHRKL
jgi:deaminated glutathione amidase